MPDLPVHEAVIVQWPAEAIWEAVVPLLPDFTIEILPELDSTNSELMRRVRAGRMEPVLLVAQRQTSGRGRLGRAWSSDVEMAGKPPGSLTFSIGLPLAPMDWSGLSLVVGTVVAERLHPQLRLKWPNDVWWQDRKLAGILIETASVGVQRYVVIGVGVNIVQPELQIELQGEDLSAGRTRVSPVGLQELLPRASAPDVLQQLAFALIEAVKVFERDGFAAFQARFRQLDALLGREVVCSDGTSGVAAGVAPDGALLVHTVSGPKRMTSAEVSVRPVQMHTELR